MPCRSQQRPRRAGTQAPGCPARHGGSSTLTPEAVNRLTRAPAGDSRAAAAPSKFAAGPKVVPSPGGYTWVMRRVAIVRKEHAMVDPGSVGDWMQALLIAAALGGLAAACGWALREEEHGSVLRPDPTREASGAVASTAVEGMQPGRQQLAQRSKPRAG